MSGSPCPPCFCSARATATVSTKLLPGYEPFADDMRVELVPDSGHFIVDEKPDLVIERTRAWLTDGAG